MRDIARKHCLQLPPELPSENVWELAQKMDPSRGVNPELSFPWSGSAPEKAPGSSPQALFRATSSGGGQPGPPVVPGSYTDGEAPAADESTKALQAIAKSLDRGKLASVGRLEERVVFLLRAATPSRLPFAQEWWARSSSTSLGSRGHKPDRSSGR